MKTIHDLLERVLDGIDVGGEQSRQFVSEIRLLKKALRLSRTLQVENLSKHLASSYFIVAGRNTTDPSAAAPCEAWLYKGPPDFAKATPVVFGSGKTVIDAITALESEAKLLKEERKVYEKVQGLGRNRRSR